MSSTGYSHDIASGTLGTTTLALNTWYFVELTYDAVSGKYVVFVNGIADQTISSTAKICSGVLSIGNHGQTPIPNELFQGYIDEVEYLPYCDHPNAIAYSVPVAASSPIVQGYASDFFSIPDMTMYQVTAGSAVAGNNPPCTYIAYTVYVHVHRVYVHVHTLYMGTTDCLHIPLPYMPACTALVIWMHYAIVQEPAVWYIQVSGRDITFKVWLCQV